MTEFRGKWRVPFQYIALEAHMTQQSNQCDSTVQTAGHQVGTALHQPLPSKACFLCRRDRDALTWTNVNHRNMEVRMNAIGEKRTGIAAVILRVSLSLLLWTIGASAMDLLIAPVTPKERYVTVNLRMEIVGAWARAWSLRPHWACFA